MSTLIEAEFSTKSAGRTSRFGGIILFYVLVFAVIIAGILWTNNMRTAALSATAPVASQNLPRAVH